MRHFISISVLVVLLALPLAGPLLAKAPCTCCSQAECEQVVKAAGGCCGASAIPDTTVPSYQAVGLHLSPPAVVAQAIHVQPAALTQAGRSLYHFPNTSHAVFPTTPLRI